MRGTRASESTGEYLEGAYEKAHALGLFVIEPLENELQIDLDSPGDQYVMEAILRLFDDYGFHISVKKMAHSRHGNKHATLRVHGPRKLTDLERVALQAILGSDRKREALGFLRVWDGIKPVSVFFETPTMLRTPPPDDLEPPF